MSYISRYSFVDCNLEIFSGDIYYRIKQVDFNGQYDYSKVLKAKTHADPGTAPEWSAYPSPTLGHP